MKTYVKLVASALLSMALAVPAMAQAESPDGPILFTNVNVFDGVSDKLIKNANVVVTGNKITAVSTEDMAVAGGQVIDGGGRHHDLRSQNRDRQRHAEDRRELAAVHRHSLCRGQRPGRSG